jgi:hypothetical protein
VQKLSGNNLDQFNKSGSVLHQEFSKIGFVFFDFSTTFYAIYKNQQDCTYYSRINLQQGPWKLLESYRYTLTLHSGPWDEMLARK